MKDIYENFAEYCILELWK